MTGASDERVVDSRGRRCPLPVIDLAKAMPDVPLGAIVAVLADDPAAAADIPAWCRMRGQEYLGAGDPDAPDPGATAPGATAPGAAAPDAAAQDAGVRAYRVRRVR